MPEGYSSSWAQYTLKAKSKEQRERLIDGLAKAGIPSMVYYPKPLHFQEVYKELGHKPGDFPISESLCERVFSLPMHGYITPEIVKTVADTLHSLAE